MTKPRIFLLHYAGGSSYSFQFLQPYLSQFDVHTVELPGRGKRIKENIIRETSAAVTDILYQIKEKIQPGRDILLGHSMGALLAFHVTHALEQMDIAPKHLIVSGNAGPRDNEDIKAVYKLDHQSFKEELKRIGGVSDEFLENAELYEFYEPILRADFKLSHDLSALNNIIIRTPIHAFMGTDETNYSNIENWRLYTQGAFSHEGLKGGHFFLHDHAASIAKTLTSCAFDQQTAPVK